ncbi:hypothetical protein SLINC_3202 [Streptomyces lincolnensis]|uniref:Uncharacterized protein n=1 Tax=Streptomyces lincolnensis TaxID=1915 RepID=A0A1B1M9W6_STRLN|nr:hypothetical protein [Streptomyces lincolnensis]ANS65426.1 hypothetical protein SLINC_3202 [Streptomyces lincolnensis]AXG56366.1 hypothetical protein SLCG_5211 [Streptomyces lincolnensis]QMV07187.1 hypothetical protein GJU35_16890 [Streptomyces lincolnensis]
MTPSSVPRRAMLRGLAGAGAGAALVSVSGGLLVPAHAAEAADGAGPAAGTPGDFPASLNGWPLADRTNAGLGVWSRPVSGAGFTLDIRLGMVETVLVHIVRRWHYEIETLRKGEVVGWRPIGELDAAAPESNQASGTAVAIRPDAYVKGVRGGLTKIQRDTVESILEDVGDVVRWGGHDRTPYEALFYIATPPSQETRPADRPVAELADKLRGWNQTPGLGAGSAA